MSMQLGSGKNEIPYSPSERKAFSVLPKNGDAIDTVTIMKKIYRKEEDPPYNSRQTVLGVMVRLQNKVKANKEPFRIARSDRKGPYPIQFWLEW